MTGHMIWSGLRARPWAAVGLCLVLACIALLIATAVSWQRGLSRATHSGADSELVYLLARGAEDAAERSVIPAERLQDLTWALPGPLAPELVHMGLAEGQGAAVRVSFRGVDPASAEVRKLSLPLWETTKNDVTPVLLGARLAREQAWTPGTTLRLLGSPLVVVGFLPEDVGFAGGEIWLPRERLSAITERPELSVVVLRDTHDAAAMLTLMRPDFALVEVREDAYLARFAASLLPLRAVAWLVSGLLTLAALAGCISAAVARADARQGELATLRALGVPAPRIAFWLLAETACLAVLSALILVFMLSWLDGTVLRLGGIAPELRSDVPVLWSAGAALLVALALVVLPALLRVLCVPVARQLSALR